MPYIQPDPSFFWTMGKLYLRDKVVPWVSGFTARMGTN